MAANPPVQQAPSQQDILFNLLQSVGAIDKYGLATIQSVFFDPNNPKMFNNDILLETALLGETLSKEALLNQAYVPPSDAKEQLMLQTAFSGLDAKVIHVETDPGVVLQGWYIAPEEGKPTILYSNGIDGDYIKSKPLISELAGEGYGILGYQFRGYGASAGGSTGTPSEAGFYHDLQALSDLLAEGSPSLGIEKTPYSQQILMGYSIGADTSIHVAAANQNEYKAVAVIDPPGSILDAYNANNQYTDPLAQTITAPFQQGIEATQSKIAGAFDIHEDIQHLNAPLFYAEGGQDVLALPDIAKSLFQSAKSPSEEDKFFLKIQKADHDTIVNDPTYADRVADKLTAFLKPDNHHQILQDIAAYAHDGKEGVYSWDGAKDYHHIPLVHSAA